MYERLKSFYIFPRNEISKYALNAILSISHPIEEIVSLHETNKKIVQCSAFIKYRASCVKFLWGVVYITDITFQQAYLKSQLSALVFRGPGTFSFVHFVVFPGTDILVKFIFTLQGAMSS